ncbi:TonB-dependent receptor plug domain-containing protein [Microbulbifer spongiae]|uniref:TonB-dependent receptor n=1 Tax=Microbulbifer spongiae TaxID=2944933 RepID=A0ABY9EAL3_9GAMM|nr:TonB-dependent receptor [Microbulbifer sp. MI-G]WKD49128.1 TonB-dependent receptor [Microbulbifer sp. MI-G]
MRILLTVKYWALLTLALLLPSFGTAAALCPRPSIQLPAGTLSQALIFLGQQCNISVLVEASAASHYVLAEQTLRSDNGQFEAALQQLLFELPFKYERISPTSVAVITADKRKHSAVKPSIHSTEEVTVTGQRLTGSHLHHSHLDGYLPVDALTSKQLEMTGAQTVADLLKFLPAISGNFTSTSVSQEGDGTATVSLRGLPASNTLVLLNGRRIISDGFKGEATDLNSIPLPMVKRIEILKDGAFAIYGSDAIAGVVNIILQRDFEGLKTSSYYGQSQENDRQTKSHHLTWGWQGDRSHLLLSLAQYQQEAVMSRDRSVSDSADSRPNGGLDQRSSAIPGGFIALSDSTVITNTITGDYQDWISEDRFNYSEFTSAIAPLDNNSLYLTGDVDIGDNAFLFAEIMGVHTLAESIMAPTPVFTRFDNDNFTITSENIYNAFSQDITDLRRRLVEIGPRKQTNRITTWRFNSGLKGLWQDWQWELGAAYQYTEKTETLSNLVDPSALALGLKGPDQCNPDVGCIAVNLLGPSGSISTEQQDFIRGDSVNNSDSQMTSVTLVADGTLAHLTSGKIGAAAGIELRREAIDSLSDSSEAVSFIGGHAPGTTKGSRIIREAFTEVSIPLTEQLWLDGALRLSHYNDFGSTSNPKLALRWKPFSALMIRGSFATGFRAPTLTDVKQQSYLSQVTIIDPCSYNPPDSLPGCTKQADSSLIEHLTEFGGNPNLKPEISKNLSLGITWTPASLKGLKATFDLYDIQQENVIGSDPKLLVEQNARSGLFDDKVIRDENGDISRIFATRLNQGNREVQGYDIALRYNAQPGHAGHFRLAFNISHILHHLKQVTPESQKEDLSGTFVGGTSGEAGSLPKWKANAGIYWNKGPWEAAYTMHYVGPLEETFTQGRSLTSRDIEDWSTHDLQFAVTPHKKLRLAIGVNNLLNQSPPLAATATHHNYDYRTYDITGRFWYGSFSLKL